MKLFAICVACVCAKVSLSLSPPLIHLRLDVGLWRRVFLGEGKIVVFQHGLFCHPSPNISSHLLSGLTLGQKRLDAVFVVNACKGIHGVGTVFKPKMRYIFEGANSKKVSVIISLKLWRTLSNDLFNKI